MRVLAKDVAAEVKKGAEIELYGWVHRIRDMGGITFVILRDRSDLVQLVFDEEFPFPQDITLESVINVRGIPALNEKAPGGAELAVRDITVFSRAAGDLPFQVNADVTKTGLEAILDNRLLSLRNPKVVSIFRVQSTITEAFATYLRAEGFTEIKSSKLVSGGTEGGTNLFQVEYFDRKVCLAQSPQFYKEVMVASGLERVFEIAPVYRAEKHDTPRHLNEYISMDIEMGFIESEKDLIELEKGLLAHIFTELTRKNKKDLEVWNASLPDADAVATAPTFTYEEALKMANAVKDKNSGGRIFDINPEAERLLCEWALKEKGIELVFVTEYPRRHRPFYTFPLPSETEGEGASDLGNSAMGNSALSMSFDCLFRGLEITSGSRRHHDYNAFLEALPFFGLKPEDQEGYLELLKYGCPPHGGFAIGLERLTQKILGLTSVKEASLFPRDRKRVTP